MKLPNFGENPSYDCWLSYRTIKNAEVLKEYTEAFSGISVLEESLVFKTALNELKFGLEKILGKAPADTADSDGGIVLGFCENIKSLPEELASGVEKEGYIVRYRDGKTIIAGKTDRGVLYGVFAFLRLLQLETPLEKINLVNNPANMLRMINHWDNMDGTIERGYAGNSIFYANNGFIDDKTRVRDYARLLASIGINGIVINNVNVHYHETRLITKLYLPEVAKLADIFREYGITVFLSVNFASPVELGELPTADPLDVRVQNWWREKAEEIYSYIPDFGGFLVKADSEYRPGPFTYGRDHAEGANMLAKALEPFGGVVIWRCFVYNCKQDWRDRKTDRANAAYDTFMPLDGKFMDNVILQIKNGPMDFQVREPVSPLFGGLTKTNQMLELQITQEYTGQQKHICYLVPQWKEILDFDTFAEGRGSTVREIIAGKIYPQKYGGIAAVSNIGSDLNWTGHVLAQANLYGYGCLAFNPDRSAEEITEEWVRLTFSSHPYVVKTISSILLKSWRTYENYTSPLGIGWMVNPGHHYGPNVDGYEYSPWGTYHRADCFGIGVDRSVETGTGFAGRYHKENAEMYNNIETCPEELLLFFHYVPYTYRLKSGKTLIQHIYDTHFEGVEQVRKFREQWLTLKELIDKERFEHVLGRLEIQIRDAIEWRDVINSYFYRKSGIPDEKGRTIY
ncbi:alpha-glucuronidase AguA [Thermoclostridium stercorarium subsp. stercorarium DSM 8532]|jgi:alpha-glucuronidase|uniref:Xylan alpha-1,2-glucuronidase n=2 Tax=Thermoclostridium stercorarium TaxID=1510 RepID=L7VMA9_THES1|nr:alpha-glucuronidase family glycosyl hydrolase [Thermoclostridium stercorarium]AGC69355.1 alpha-glucuronidase AguA [Thermoclostridium stercorarium subsp. stercorarium DSM 8532]AGI40315.1 alpha-glucuronidase [Thermoclostridium stercorarium subsp. stercorarium DSM 8532]ANW99612.1 alpha-glucuronidase [Thermoclostridium stercorarium subsp. thermolacticum DSM 2910]